MRTFDDLCLTPIQKFTPQQIQDLRLRERASQADFARYGAAADLLQGDEVGRKLPEAGEERSVEGNPLVGDVER